MFMRNSTLYSKSIQFIQKERSRYDLFNEFYTDTRLRMSELKILLIKYWQILYIERQSEYSRSILC